MIWLLILVAMRRGRRSMAVLLLLLLVVLVLSGLLRMMLSRPFEDQPAPPAVTSDGAFMSGWSM